VKEINIQPKRLFIIDGIGALISAISLGYIMIVFNSIFGLPKNVLYLLATIPLFFLVFDMFAYYWGNEKIGWYLKIIVFLNVGYCILSLGLLSYHFSVLTKWAMIYFVVEICIVLALSRIEWCMAQTVGGDK